jgi:hypothetical protein
MILGEVFRPYLKRSLTNSTYKANAQTDQAQYVPSSVVKNSKTNVKRIKLSEFSVFKIVVDQFVFEFYGGYQKVGMQGQNSQGNARNHR